MSDIHQVITPGEKILWEDKPQFWPFVWSALPVVLFGLLFAFLSLAMTAVNGFTVASLLIPHFWIGVILGPGYLIYTILVYRFVHYVITDKRTIIQRGVIGRDYQSIEHDQVTSTAVKVGLGDKLFGQNSGSVMITHAGGSQSKNGKPLAVGLVSITDPYKVYQLFNKVSHDVRSDIQYPNALRPGENKGYDTEYKV